MASVEATNPGAVNEGRVSLNSVIRQSYSNAKNYLHDGMTVIKDEFIGIYDKAETYFNIIAQPVNNFLKDLTQIEQEFQYELEKINHQVPASSNANVIPIEMALCGRMEENY